jgi:hypothetical protein
VWRRADARVVVTRLRLDADRRGVPRHRVEADQQQRELNDRIVPLVSASPGFVEGRWARHADARRHVSFVVFEDEASATSFAEFVRGRPCDSRTPASQMNRLRSTS